MDIYHAYTIWSTDEALLGLLTQFEFESFEENEDHYVGYISKKNLSPEIKKDIAATIALFTDKVDITEILPQNWNEIWEASFQPVIVEDFCQIRATFHPPVEGIKYDLIIDPKMAFGTGHHATTYMMVKQMEAINFVGKCVFDFGCGTGILAILASKLGARHIDAIDIEQESYENTIENNVVNNINNVSIFCGDLNDAPNLLYDVILANINRNILIKYADDLVNKLSAEGIILVSGILSEDEETLTYAFNHVGLRKDKVLQREGWISASFIKI
ncbi:MAG: 50S ribosomal protein L11 methyltransferase [Saprospiraceae bacterium]|nr:50S ribosomal protein L11 methyltransferase [Saprospiraceae bacterium]